MDLPYHRKYRPSSLKDYKGMEKVKETVTKALATGKRPQTILLYGDSGCGKTTLARILAKEYNCLDRDSETGACGLCYNCQAIDEYIRTGDTDLLSNVKEVDIGENSGKNDLEGVLSDVEIPGMGDEWKIYIFDEIQSASVALQNRLLKVTEEPPENVLFIFCTTNPEKLLPTLKNRCQISLKITKPDLNSLVSLLKDVCNKEGGEYDRRGLEFLANRSEFVMRTSLQKLWKVVMEQNSAKYELVTKVFEEVPSKQIIRFFKALKSGDTFDFVTCICEVKGSMELSLFLSELRSFLVRGIYIVNALPVEGVSESEYPIYKGLFGSMSIKELGLLMSRLLNLDYRNLEMDLLLLGYQGIMEDKPVAPDVECAMEQANANKVIAEKHEIDFAKGVKNAEGMMEEVSLEALLSMGGTIVR